MRLVCVLLGAVTVINGSNICSADIVYIDDGQSHDNYEFYGDSVRLDYNVANLPGTHFNSLEGGTIRSLWLWNNSTARLEGGVIEVSITAYNNSIVIMNEGLIRQSVAGSDNVVITMNGGIIEGSFAVGGHVNASINNGAIHHIWAEGSADVFINGGSVSSGVAVGGLEGRPVVTITGGHVGLLSVNQDGMIYLVGSNFEVNGQTLSYGDKLRDFATYYDTPQGYGNHYYGVVLGSLSDGSLLDTEFAIYDQYGYTGDIVIIPEPVTVILLGIGALLLRRRTR